MIKVIISIVLLIAIQLLQAQNESLPVHENKNDLTENKTSQESKHSEVDDAFHSPVLINSQTSEVLHKKAIELLYEQRFGNINSGNSDLYGLNTNHYNLRFGIAYGVTDKMALSIGIIKLHSLVDVGYKHILLKQKKTTHTPITLTYYGNITTSLENSEEFSKITDRMSFFNQLIVSRKFGNYFSVFVAPGFMYFNIIENDENDKKSDFILALGSKINLTHHISLILEYGQGHLFNSANKSNPGVSFGVETIIKNLSFQVFATTFNEISEQDNYMYNHNDYSKGDFLIGFNIGYKLNDH